MFDVSVQNLFKHIYRSNVDLICESLHDLPSRQNLPEQATAIPDKYIWSRVKKKTRPILIKRIYRESLVAYHR